MKILSRKITRIFIACILIILGAISYSNANIKINNQEEKYLNEYNKAIKNMEDNMLNVTKTGNIDLDYLYEMIVHHQGAIDMSNNLLKYGGQNHDVKKIAEKIIFSQTASIERMNMMIDTLNKNPIKDTCKESEYLKEYEAALSEMMKGFASLKPTGNIDKDFLEEMIVHHQGAMNMVKAIQKYSDNNEIKAMAEKESNSQMPEIEKMKEIAESIK